MPPKSWLCENITKMKCGRRRHQREIGKSTAKKKGCTVRRQSRASLDFFLLLCKRKTAIWRFGGGRNRLVNGDHHHFNYLVKFRSLHLYVTGGCRSFSVYPPYMLEAVVIRDLSCGRSGYCHVIFGEIFINDRICPN